MRSIGLALGLLAAAPAFAATPAEILQGFQARGAAGFSAPRGERFYRILGTEPSGSGLGLSIVERIAALHGAKVALGEGANGKGLRVSVAFPGART